MNILDIIILIPLLWLAWRGFSKGFVIELASLAALILGIYVAVHSSGIASELLSDNFNIDQDWLPYLAFAITFVLVVLGVHLIGKIVEKLVDIVALGFINKLLGAAFGVIKAALFLSIILYFIAAFDTNENLISKEKKENSLFYQPIESIVPFLIPKLRLDELDFKDEKEALEEIV